MGPDLFFPIGETTDEALRQTAEAVSVCMQCPVRLHCMVWSLVTNPAPCGIWGGLTPAERRVMRRDRRLRHLRRGAKAQRPGRLNHVSPPAPTVGATETVA